MAPKQKFPVGSKVRYGIKMKAKTETYIFTFRTGPNWHRFSSAIKRFRNSGEAGQFADGLKRGGATDVDWKLERRFVR